MCVGGKGRIEKKKGPRVLGDEKPLWSDCGSFRGKRRQVRTAGQKSIYDVHGSLSFFCFVFPYTDGIGDVHQTRALVVH